MTDSQWIFHAKEIAESKKEKRDILLDVTEAYIQRIENASHWSGIFARKDIKFDTVKDVMRGVDERRAKLYGERHKISVDVKDELLRAFNEVKDVAPLELNVEDVDEFIENMPRVKVARKRRRARDGE